MTKLQTYKLIVFDIPVICCNIIAVINEIFGTDATVSHQNLQTHVEIQFDYTVSSDRGIITIRTSA